MRKIVIIPTCMERGQHTEDSDVRIDEDACILSSQINAQAGQTQEENCNPGYTLDHTTSVRYLILTKILMLNECRTLVNSLSSREMIKSSRQELLPSLLSIDPAAAGLPCDLANFTYEYGFNASWDFSFHFRSNCKQQFIIF